MARVVPTVIQECLRDIETGTVSQQELASVGFTDAFRVGGSAYKANITGPVRRSVVSTAPVHLDVQFPPISGCSAVMGSIGGGVASFVTYAGAAFEADGYTFSMTGRGQYTAVRAGTTVRMRVTTTFSGGTSYTEITVRPANP